MNIDNLPKEEINFFRSLLGSSTENVVKRINEKFSPVDKHDPNGVWYNDTLQVDLHFKTLGYFYIKVDEHNLVNSVYWEGPTWSITVKFDELHVKEKL